MPHTLARLGDGVSDLLNLLGRQAAVLSDTVVCLRDRISDFLRLEDNFSAVSFDDVHVTTLLWKYNWDKSAATRRSSRRTPIRILL